MPSIRRHDRHPSRSVQLAAAAVWFAGGAGAKPLPETGLAAYDEGIRPLIETHCLACHGGDEIEGEVDFTEFDTRAEVLGKDDLWRRVFDAVDFEDMPPKPEKTGFGDKHRKRLMAFVEDEVLGADITAEEFQHPGPSFIRQLTPYEYMNSVRDLTGMEEIPFDRLGIEQEFPKEGHEFVNQALGMTLSVEQFDTFLRAGDQVLRQLFGDRSGIWNKTRGMSRRYMKAGEAAKPEVLFVEPGEELGEREAAARILERFASRAFRRPLGEGGVDEFLTIFDRAAAGGAEYETALRYAMSAVLASPHFLLRTEEDQAPAGSDEVYPVKPYELATRLSYFLWSSLPDERLLELAASGELLEDEVLEAEVERMLADERAKALTEHFAYQWLQLKLMDLPSVPNRRGFPKLTSSLESSFRREMEHFFDHVRKEDRTILDFLDSDYTFVDRELGEFYGIEDPAVKKLPKPKRNQVSEMIRVELEPSLPRGGLMAMGGPLWMNSHESRTKPTQRGLWILEVILGTPPPPPPPEAGSFAPPEEGAPEPKNFREKLEQHASDPSCAGCHAKIDPLGFALEDFDAIGSFRTEENGEPVDHVGRLPSGEEFAGFRELQEVILDRGDQFTVNFISQMLRYGLGRELLPTDRGTVELIRRRVMENEHRFSEVMKGVALSRPFRQRVNLDSIHDPEAN